jgi:hypothetical protein
MRIRVSPSLEAFLNQLIGEDKVVLEGTQYRRRNGA